MGIDGGSDKVTNELRRQKRRKYLHYATPTDNTVG